MCISAQLFAVLHTTVPLQHSDRDDVGAIYLYNRSNTGLLALAQGPKRQPCLYQQDQDPRRPWEQRRFSNGKQLTHILTTEVVRETLFDV